MTTTKIKFNQYDGNISCVAYSAATIQISGSHWCTLPLPAELNDHSDWHSTGTNNERIYAPVAGIYMMSIMNVGFPVDSTGGRGVKIRLNGGGTTVVQMLVAPSDLDSTYISTIGVRSMAAGDYVDMQAWSSATGTRPTISSFYKLGLVLLSAT